MPLVLYNSLTRRKEPFEPLDPERVRMYVCGPTVYDLAHIGNGRAVVVFDQLYRLLRHTYGAEHVRYVRNITDIDDKIINAARENGEPIEALTRRTTALFHADMAALGALPPDVEPRCTEHVPQMIAMIERLIACRSRLRRRGARAVRGRLVARLRQAVAPQPAGDDRRRPRRGRARTSATRAISCCGNRHSETSPAGTARGGAAVPAGTSNARR